MARGFAESLEGNINSGLLSRLSPEERNQKVHDKTEKIISQINRTLEIAERFSAFTKPYGGKSHPEPVRLSEAVENVLSLVGHELEIEKIRIDKQVNSELITFVDRRHLEEILINLLTHAYHAMPAGGSLRIEGRADTRCAVMRISDTGVGIPPDKIKKVFEPFFSTRKEGGTGLGLFIVKKLVESNDGEIKVASAVGQGTTFTIEFPFVSSNEEFRKILITDDEQ